MIRLWNTRSHTGSHRTNYGTLRSGDRAGQAMSPKREIATAPLRWTRLPDLSVLNLRNGFDKLNTLNMSFFPFIITIVNCHIHFTWFLYYLLLQDRIRPTARHRQIETTNLITNNKSYTQHLSLRVKQCKWRRPPYVNVVQILAWLFYSDFLSQSL